MESYLINIGETLIYVLNYLKYFAVAYLSTSHLNAYMLQKRMDGIYKACKVETYLKITNWSIYLI